MSLDQFQYIATVIRGEESIAREIVNYCSSNAIEIIIISSHGRSALESLILGSVAERILRTADCPVMVISPFGSYHRKRSGTTNLRRLVLFATDLSEASLEANSDRPRSGCAKS